MSPTKKQGTSDYDVNTIIWISHTQQSLLSSAIHRPKHAWGKRGTRTWINIARQTKIISPHRTIRSLMARTTTVKTNMWKRTIRLIATLPVPGITWLKLASSPVQEIRFSLSWSMTSNGQCPQIMINLSPILAAGCGHFLPKRAIINNPCPSRVIPNQP